jgi:chemotaxis protein histidine kinase CheA
MFCLFVACVVAGALLVFVHVFHQVLNQLPTLRTGVTEDDVKVYLGKYDGLTLDQHYGEKKKVRLAKEKEEKKAAKAAALAAAAAPKKKKEAKKEETSETTTPTPAPAAAAATSDEKKSDGESSSSSTVPAAEESKKGGEIELNATIGGSPTVMLDDDANKAATPLNKSSKSSSKKSLSVKEGKLGEKEDYEAPKLSLFDGPSFTW